MTKQSEIPEVAAAQVAYDSLVSVCAEYQAVKKASASNTATRLHALQAELEKANAVLDQANEDAASEQIHKGKTSAATAAKIQDAIHEVARVQSAYTSVKRYSSLAIYELQKRRQQLEFNLNEEATKQRELKYKAAISQAPEQKQSFLLELQKSNARMAEQQDELNQAESDLAILGDYNGQISVDAATKAAAVKALDTAVRSWRERAKLRDDLLEKFKATTNEIERLKDQAAKLLDAISAVNPDFLGHVLAQSELHLALWPELIDGYNLPESVTSKLRQAVNQ